MIVRTQILAIGDSVTEGYGATRLDAPWVEVVARRLGGRGAGFDWLKPAYGSPTVPYPVVLSGDTARIYGRAIGREETRLQGSGATAGTVVWEFSGDRCELVYTRGSIAGIARVEIDDLPPVLVDTNAPVVQGNIGSWVSPFLGRGRHTVRVSRDDSTPSGKDPHIHGLATYDGDYQSGVRVLNGGRSGARSYQFVDQTGGTRRSRWVGTSAARLWGADLLIIAVGINDSRDDPAVSKAEYKANVQQIITDVREYGFSGPVLLVSMYQVHADQGDHAMRVEYGVACDEIASSESVIYHLNLLDVLPQIGTPEADEAGLYVDGLHPSDKGHQVIGDLVADYIIANGLLDRPGPPVVEGAPAEMVISDGVVRLPNRGDAAAYPVIKVMGTTTGVTIVHDEGTWTLDPTTGGAVRILTRDGDVFYAGGTRAFGVASGAQPVVAPGGATWTVSGVGDGLVTVSRTEAWS